MLPLPPRFILAATPWPRTGGNARNSGRVAFEGPRRGRIAVDVALPVAAEGVAAWRGGGVVVGAHGDLVVAAHGCVARIALDGRAVHVATIPALDPGAIAPTRRVLAPPVALADGSVVVVASPEVLVFDADGVVRGRVHAGNSVDDSGLSPNVTRSGALVLTHMTGEIAWWRDGTPRAIGAFGYDIVPPALFDDDAMVIAGYAGAGLVCVASDGRRRWHADLADADLSPAIDARGVTAAGSSNESRSLFVAADGAVVGSLACAAVFAEGDEGAWFARAEAELLCVHPNGDRVWTRACAAVGGLAWGAQAPVADGARRVYALEPDGLHARDATTGDTVFRAATDGAPMCALALVAPGLAAVQLAGRLVLIE